MSDALVPRARLSLDRMGISHKPAICVQAPAGFGKTSLLIQWRRSAQARGAVVVWLTADEYDDALRVARAVGGVLASVKAQRGGDSAFLGGFRDQESGIEALTELLAQIADLPFDVVAIIDNVERSRGDRLYEALGYLIRNAPANFQLVVSSRSGTVLDIPDIADQNIVARISTSDLSFTYDETIAIIAKHFDDKISIEAAGKLHEQTEGWPLGLQLVIATLRKSHDVQAAIRGVSARAGDIQRYFVENLIDRLAPELSNFLTRISIFDVIHPALCAAVFSTYDVGDLLARLERDTPVFLHAEGSQWMRMHGLARDFLLTRFHSLPAEERRYISQQACNWLGEQELYEEAARHALLAGQDDVAYALAERTLYQVGYRGNISEVLKWIDRLPAAELRRRQSLWTAAAWSLALTNRRQEAERIIEYIVSERGGDVRQRFEAALISAVAANFDDQPERSMQSIDPWIVQTPPELDEKTERIFKNVLGSLSFQQYEIGKARHIWTQVAQSISSDAEDYSSGFAEFGVGLSYLWEGQVRMAEQYLRAALTRCEQDMGRRNPIPCMMATVLAATLWEMGGVQEPQAILSYRLDVIERAAVPEAVMLAYLALARLAVHAGQESRGLEYLDSMIVLGEARSMPRLQIAGLCEQVRLHAQACRPETVARLCRKLEAICQGPYVANRPAIESWVTLHKHRALAYQTLMLREWTQAVEHLTTAARCADLMGLGRDSVEIRLLRAVALRHSTNVDVSDLFRESLSLARASGMVRTLLETHPDALNGLREISQETDFRVSDLLQALSAPEHPLSGPSVPGHSIKGDAADRTAKRSGAFADALLTSKEREILGLLATNMSNKEIAFALDIGAGTVKWHVKNIFAKLDAGNRAHAVKRAHLLGIVDTTGK
ncbi:LuxR C-terminal-related transcriptional regulator [Paraburkholderia steynii]|nr:LuxR C-terminal-related transcriptional regulator [Paraburkholderia steynii]